MADKPKFHDVEPAFPRLVLAHYGLRHTKFCSQLELSDASFRANSPQEALQLFVLVVSDVFHCGEVIRRYDVIPNSDTSSLRNRQS